MQCMIDYPPRGCVRDHVISLIFGRPFLKRFALCYRTIVCPVLPLCNVGVLWPNGWMNEDETWHAGRPRPWPHCPRWHLAYPHRKRHSHLQFSAHICCGLMDGWIKMPLDMEVGLVPAHKLLDRDPSSSQKGVRAPPPNFFGPCLLSPNGWMGMASAQATL